MQDRNMSFQSAPHFKRQGMWVLLIVLLSPVAVMSQTVDDTVRFIGDMTNSHGFVRTLSCRNSKSGKATKITEVYSVIPTGNKLGAVELNHGHDELNTGFTRLDLHDIDTIAVPRTRQP